MTWAAPALAQDEEAKRHEEQEGTPPAQPADDRPAEAAPAPAPASTVDPALRAMFEKAAQRIRDARTLSFHARTSHTGTLLGKSPAAEADVRMIRTDVPTRHWRFRSTGSGGRNPEEPSPFDVVWDRQTVSWLDRPAKKLYERPAGGAKGPIVQTAMAPIPTQLQETAPFSREIAAESMMLEGSETVGGVGCDVITVRYRARSGVTKFYLAESDGLPRRIERISESTSYPNSTLFELTDLKIDEPLSADHFTIALPEGFERDAVGPAPRVAVRAAEAPDTGAAPGAASPAPPSPAPPPPREEFPGAPAFSLPAPDGSSVSLASLKGSIVVLYFWGTWSLPSRDGADPEVQALHEAYKDRPVKVLGMSVREKSPEVPAEFLRAQGRTYTNLSGADSAARAYSVVRYPTFVIIDTQGRLRKTIEGFKAGQTPGELRQAVDGLLANPPSASGA